MYGKSDYLAGSYIKVDTTKIKVTDLNDMATALDKLFAIAAVSINDIIEMIGGERIDEEWANKRFVTKNYTDTSQLDAMREVNELPKRRYKNEKYAHLASVDHLFEASVNDENSEASLTIYGDIGESWWGESTSAKDIEQALKTFHQLH